MKKFAFVSDAAEREYKNLPENVQDEFGKDLRKIQYGQSPLLPIAYLDSIGQYVTKYLESVIVLHSFSKTTNGVDRQAMKVAEQRFKELLAELKGN